MGRRKLGEETNVMNMNVVPNTEKQDATRSIVSNVCI